MQSNKNTIACTRCGTENPGHYKYCNRCGYELPKVAAENIVAAAPAAKSKKRVSLALTIGLVAGGLILGLVIGTLIGATATYIYFNGASQFPTVEKTSMDKLSNSANQNLPMMIDSETRLDNVMATDSKTFRYTYTLVNMEQGKVDTTAMKSRAEPYILNSVKTAPELERQRNQGMTFVCYYKDKNGNYLFSIIITPDKYR